MDRLANKNIIGDTLPFCGMILPATYRNELSHYFMGPQNILSTWFPCISSRTSIAAVIVIPHKQLRSPFRHYIYRLRRQNLIPFSIKKGNLQPHQSGESSRDLEEDILETRTRTTPVIHFRSMRYSMRAPMTMSPALFAASSAFGARSSRLGVHKRTMHPITRFQP